MLHDLQMTITVNRPSARRPDGYIGLLCVDAGTCEQHQLAWGPHTHVTLEQVLRELKSMVFHGKAEIAFDADDGLCR
jgi:hypothetical protein